MGPATPSANAATLLIGLDLHTAAIAVSIVPGDSTEVRRYGLIGGTHEDVLKLAKKLQAPHPGMELRFCYEAGPHGYPLDRCLRAHGYECILVAPSKIPRLPGDRVKTNRRDADQLARPHRAGELTAIYVPDPQDEAVRDLIRARAQVVSSRRWHNGFVPCDVLDLCAVGVGSRNPLPASWRGNDAKYGQVASWRCPDRNAR